MSRTDSGPVACAVGPAIHYEWKIEGTFRRDCLRRRISEVMIGDRVYRVRMIELA